MSNPQPRTIVIVGGVAGGASAATRARRMNEHARIILFEKDHYVSFANCGLPYYIGDEITRREKLLVATPELLRSRFNIEVHTRCEVTAIQREKKQVRVLNRDSGETFDQPYDKLILAPGASPVVPPIEGVDADNVFTLRNVEDTDRIHTYIHNQLLTKSSGDRDVPWAVVVGAGFIGLEMVEQLHRLGLRVALVELMDQVLPPFDPEMARSFQNTLEANGIELHLGDGIRAIHTSGGVASEVELNSGLRLNADFILLSIGVRPNTLLAETAGLKLGASRGIATNAFMQTSDPDIYAVGDAAEYVHAPTGLSMRIALAGPANRAGRIAGQHAVVDDASPMTPVMGTAIVRLFDVAGGMTGLTEKQARKLDRPARSVIIRANHHAGYYPGAQPLTIKLVYEPDTGKVLGAQVLGGQGVDKRIDVIATAMHFGATVHDLAGLDLAYAPPFGAAKDPIHMAAFAACNELDGLVRFSAPDAPVENNQFVDVRFRDEVEQDPLPGAVSIPLDELRDRLDELDPSRATVTICAVGQRGYVAARLLMQNGFNDVTTLSGGASMFHLTHGSAEPSPA